MCWIAYGDGYLDRTNAKRVATATARLQIQLALALDESVAEKLIGTCKTRQNGNVQTTWSVQGAISESTQSGDKTAAGNGEIRLEGVHIVHIYKRTWKQNDRIVLRLRSTDFDTFLQVRGPHAQSWKNDDFLVLRTDSGIDFEVPETGEYEVRVSAGTTGQGGAYALSETAGVNTLDPERCRLRNVCSKPTRCSTPRLHGRSAKLHASIGIIGRTARAETSRVR